MFGENPSLQAGAMQPFLVVLPLLFIGNTGATDFQCWNFKSTDELRNHYLNEVNKLREKIAKGTETTNNGGKVPQGKNIYRLFWDCLLEEQAEKVVEQCKIDAPTPDGLSMVINKVSLNTCNPTPELKKTVNAWWNVVKNQSNLPSPVLNTEALKSFATLAHGDATRIGCAQKNCNGELYMVCVVFKKSPEMNQPIYEVGTGCAKNEDCTTYAESRCNKNSKMCVAGYIDPTATTTTVTTQSTTTASSTQAPGGQTTPSQTTTVAVTSTIPPDQNKMCPENTNILSDLVRTRFLRRHNSQRSAVARGTVVQGSINQMARPSSAMMRLHYMCDVERQAYESAKKCSNPNNTPNENHIVLNGDLDSDTAAKQATNSWTAEITRGRFDQGPNRRNAYLPELGLPHYAKMVWDTNTVIGCAVVKCGSSTHVVCRYGPRVGIRGNQVYKPGQPCNRCTRGCSKNEGLCG